MTPAETAVILWGDRHVPWEATAQQAQALLASGVVDYAEVSDQTVGFIPPSLWSADKTPMAAALADPDSLDDGVVTATIAAATAPGLGVTIGTDCVRTPPAEFVQTMWSLAKLTKGKAMFHIGTGEVKQCAPYGHRRSQGVKRMEDLAKIFNLLWEAEEPVDYDGHHTTLKGAYLGAARPYRPELWALGGGPRLLDIATSHLDGIAVAAPSVWVKPEQAAEEIGRLRADVKRKGRDPASFRFGIWSPVLLHENAEAMDQALDNPLVRWMAAVFGRIHPENWRREGIEPAVPDGWTYYQKLLPYAHDQAFIDGVIAKATREMAEAAYFHGTAGEVAARMQAFVEAGVDWFLPVDYMPVIVPPEQAAACLPRSIEVCAHLKGKAAA